MTSAAPRRFVSEPFYYHQELEVKIENLTNEGRGVARVNGWVVFVSFALPDERVKCRIYRNHKNYSEADLVEVLEASPYRVQPVCGLFGTCGGCQYQHVTYEQQLKWKRQQVEELLRHLAKIEHPVEPVMTSPQAYGYRSKITPHFHKPKEGQVGDIGFLRAGTRNALVDVERCPIAMPELNAALTKARAAARAGSFRNGATLLLRAAENGVLTRPDAVARERVGHVKFEFQAGDFFQNNPFILPQFVEYAVAEAKAPKARFLVDAYCGSGLFGICAAPHFEEVLGVELSETAVRKASHNAELNGLKNCRFLAADASAIFSKVPHSGAETVVIIDPPRAGCSEGFLSQLFHFQPQRVVYVSCNPATQMRDLAQFVAADYRLEKVQPFDLFPQTRHLECVMTLTHQSAA